MGGRPRRRNWLIVILVAVSFPVLIYLGFWAAIGFMLSRGGY